MKKLLFSLLVLALVGVLLWVNYGGFFLLQGSWVCQSVDSSLFPAGVTSAGLSLAGLFGGSVGLRFTLGKMYVSAGILGSSAETEFDYLAQTGRLIFDDFALRFSVKGDTLVLSNTAGAKAVFTKQNK